MSQMKITAPTRAKQRIPYSSIPVGAVYRMLGDTIALKLTDGGAVVLTYANGDNWFGLARGLKGEPATEILGYIDEIVLKETP